MELGGVELGEPLGEEGVVGERALGEPRGEEGVVGERSLGEEGGVGEGVGLLPLKQSKVDKGQIKCMCINYA